MTAAIGPARPPEISSTQQVKIINTQRIHMEHASQLVDLAKKFDSDITLQVAQKTANARSVIAVFTLGMKFGTTVTVSAKGKDQADALAAVVEFLKNCK